jgi:type II secretory pathway component GspD/PulD (secretin)
MGRPVDILFIEGLVREFDTKSDDRNFLRRKLKFLPVNDFLNIAEDALNRAFTGTGTGAGAGGAAGAGGGPAGGATGGSNRTSSNRTSQLGGGSSQFGGQSGNNNQGGMGAQGGGGGGGSSLSQSNVSSAPESRLIGRTLLVADNITNSIVVQGPPAGVEIIEKLLDQVDVKADQVMISTIIGQVTLEDEKDVGIDYLFLDRDGDYGGRGGAGNGPLLDLDPATPFDPDVLTGGGLNLYGKIGSDLRVFINALQSKTDFTVLSRPSVFTSNNQVGIISSGERIAIPTNSNSFSTGGQSTNIEYRDVVLKLEVRPLINSSDEITLEIALLNDEVAGNQTLAGAGPNGQNLIVPRITTRELLTTVTVRHGETIVLGGLIITREGKEVSGIPLLSDIPGLGRLFSSTIDTKDRSELLVFIQPSIVTDPESTNRVQTDMDSRYAVSGDARTFADGPGVLPPVDAIAPAPGTGNAAPAAKPVPVTNDGSNFNRDLKRPPHRR